MLVMLTKCGYARDVLTKQKSSERYEYYEVEGGLYLADRHESKAFKELLTNEEQLKLF